MTPDQRTALREALDPHPLTATMVQNVELVSLLDAADRADRMADLLDRVLPWFSGAFSGNPFVLEQEIKSLLNELGATR